MSRRAPAELTRGIRRFDMIFLATNLIIGGGIYGLPSRVFGVAGPWSILAFPLCAVITGLVVLCYAEMASRFDGPGGPYLYAHYTFGPLPGFMVGWLLWTARMASFTTVVSILLDYLGYLWPAAAPGPWRTAVGVSILVLYTTLDLLPVRLSAIFSSVITVAKLLPLAVFVAIGAFYVRLVPASFGPLPRPAAAASTILLVSFAFSGFESASVLAGETKDARRALPLALLAAIGTATLIYTGVQLVCVGTFPGLAASTSPLADASARFFGPWAGRMIALGAVVSAGGSLYAMMLSVPRLPYSMARQGLLPPFLAATHPRFHIPHAAVLITSAGMLYVFLTGTFLSALTFSLVARLAAYTCTLIGLLVLRRRPAAPPALFRAPGGPVAPVLALVFCFWLLLGAKPRDLYSGALAAGAGLAVYGIGLWQRRRA
ncbi:MAG TPA: APC family permease [Candidatus Saccharimonadales bacterium]|nr:APC family permease [Candidatus Saccharimonadales bacterium]